MKGPEDAKRERQQQPRRDEGGQQGAAGRVATSGQQPRGPNPETRGGEGGPEGQPAGVGRAWLRPGACAWFTGWPPRRVPCKILRVAERQGALMAECEYRTTHPHHFSKSLTEGIYGEWFPVAQLEARERFAGEE